MNHTQDAAKPFMQTRTLRAGGASTNGKRGVMHELEWKLAYDVEAGKAGCALVQAAMGGNVPNNLLDHLRPWALAPTPGMVVYQMTSHDLALLIALHRKEARDDLEV